MTELSKIKKRGELPELFNKIGFKFGAEIGVADGRFSEVICKAMPEVLLYCVDPWEVYKGNSRGGGEEQQHGNYELAQQRLKPYNVAFIRQKSMDAVKSFDDNQLDFVYIDANHDFDYVMQDLIEWSKKVRPGGIVAGHDYYHFTRSGVIEAVDAYIAAHGIRQWYITDEREPSFFWIKPEKPLLKRVKERVT